MNVTSLPATSPSPGNIQSIESEIIDKLQRLEQENSFWGMKSIEWQEHSLTILGVTLFISAFGAFTLAYFGYVVVWITLPFGGGLLLAGVVAMTIFNLVPHYDSSLYLRNVRQELEERYQFLEALLGEEDETQHLLLNRRASSFLTNIAEKEHDWESMFRYGIPLPSRFKEYFLLQVAHMDLSSAIDFYSTVVSEYQKARALYGDQLFTYEIPHPREWVGNRWIQETQSMPLAHILQCYNSECLKNLEVITADEADSLLACRSGFRAIKLRFDEGTGEYQKTYLRAITPIVLRYKNRVKKIHENFEFHSAMVKLHGYKQNALSELVTLREKKEEELEEPRRLIEQYCQASMSGNYRNYWTRRQTEEENHINEIEERYELFKNDVRVRYKKLEQPLERVLETEKRQYDRALADAQHEFRVSSASIKEDYERLIAPFQLDYERALRSLEERYDREVRLPRY